MRSDEDVLLVWTGVALLCACHALHSGNGTAMCLHDTRILGIQAMLLTRLDGDYVVGSMLHNTRAERFNLYY